MPLFKMLEPLVLASGSPRRKEMLDAMGLSFEVITSGVDESGGVGEAPEALVRRWAGEKAAAVARLRPNCWVIGADTIVVLDGTIFGKPESPDEASSMLRQLAGRSHEVMSAVALARLDRGFTRVECVRTEVRFKPLSEKEIRAYVHTGEPMDKAGAYGIQGLGAFLVEAVSGSYTNVVGLPLSETLEWLKDLGVIAPL
ncbi:MAG: Maf family protein [Acidobacteriota bacterium]